MRLWFQCAQCRTEIAAPRTSSVMRILEKVLFAGPWTALGDGETFEDQIYNELAGNEGARCPQCGRPMKLTEESLGRCSLEMLLQW